MHEHDRRRDRNAVGADMKPDHVNPVHAELPLLCEGVAVAMLFAIVVVWLAMWSVPG
jgi:hypothetical protein